MSDLFRRLKSAFMREPQWFTYGVAFVVSLGVYLMTLAPTVTLENSGSMITAADYMGVANSPGYPLWTVLAWSFQWLFRFVRYHGQPNPAWGVNFMSAFFGSASCAIIAWLICRSGINWIRRRAGRSVSAVNVLACAVSGVTAALLFAFSPAMWSQSVIAEAHTLNVFVLMLFLMFLYRWAASGSFQSLLMASFLLGLGTTTNHTTFVLIMAFPLILLLIDARVFRRGWLLLGIFALMLVGYSFNLHMFFASAQNPPINWGYAQTLEGFLYMLSRGQYERIVPMDVLGDPGAYWLALKSYISGLVDQFTVGIALLGVISLFVLGIGDRVMRRWMAVVIVVFLTYSAGLLIFLNTRFDVQTLFIARVYLIPSYAMYAMLIGYGLMTMLTMGDSRGRLSQ